MRAFCCWLLFAWMGASAAECKVQILPTIDYSGPCTSEAGPDALDKSLFWIIRRPEFELRVTSLNKDYALAEVRTEFRGEKATYRSERLIYDGTCMSDGTILICLWPSKTPPTNQIVTITNPEPTGLPLPVVNVEFWCSVFDQKGYEGASNKKRLCIHREQIAYDKLKGIWSSLDDDEVKLPCLSQAAETQATKGYHSAILFTYENILKCATSAASTKRFKDAGKFRP